jgi:site-specific recombinase XerD
MLIRDAIEEYLSSKRNAITHDTYAWYTYYLDCFEDWCSSQHLTDLSSLTATHVQQFVSASPTTNTHSRHARAQIVKGFLTWCAVDEELGVRERTIKRIEMPKVEQSDVTLFSDEDIRKLFRACDKMRNPHQTLY